MKTTLNSMLDAAVPTLQKRVDSIVRKASLLRVLVTQLANLHALTLVKSSFIEYFSFFSFNVVFLFSSKLSKDFFDQSYYELLANVISTGEERLKKRQSSEAAKLSILSELTSRNEMVRLLPHLVFIFSRFIFRLLFSFPSFFLSSRAHVQPQSFPNDLATFEHLNNLCFASLETYWRMKKIGIAPQRKDENMHLQPGSKFSNTFSNAVKLLDVENLTTKVVMESIRNLKVHVLTALNS